MKTLRNTIASIATAAITLAASTATSHAVERTLILLQENSKGKDQNGKPISYLDGLGLPPQVLAVADSIIDASAEGGEAGKLYAMALPVYGPTHVINLSDADCTRAKLLNNLIAETKAGRTVDLAIFGHGNNDLLGLHDGAFLTGITLLPGTQWTLPGGQTANYTDLVTSIMNQNTLQSAAQDPMGIRSLLTEARAREGQSFNFKLRLVYMCNCFGSTLNDDWLAIGAKTSVGSLHNDYMPEPMLSTFWWDFMNNDKPAREAASGAWTGAKDTWRYIPTYQDVNPETNLNKLDDSKLIVTGNGDLIFKDEYQMAVGDSRTFPVKANETHKFPLVYVTAGQRYTYSATGTWTNGINPPAPFPPTAPTSNANGYAPSNVDRALQIRFPSANMMCLVGELFSHPNVTGFIAGSGFKVGTGLGTANQPSVAGGTGFLNFYANDVMVGFPATYGDNSGQVSVTIKRIQ